MKFMGEEVMLERALASEKYFRGKTYRIIHKLDGSSPVWTVILDKGPEKARLFFFYDFNFRLLHIQSDDSQGVRVDVEKRQIEGETFISPTQKHIILLQLEPEIPRGKELGEGLKKFASEEKET